jgi:hypothetical protein
MPAFPWSDDMLHRLKLVMTGAALLALPGIAQAQASNQIQLNSTVAGACGLGAPDTDVINLHDLTGPDGTLDAAKTGSAVLGTATIADAWCNAPHTLSLESTAMTLQRNVPYAQPAYMARRVTYNATLLGWAVGTIIRPRNDHDLATFLIDHAYAAPAAGLRLQISKLQTLATGNTEQAGLILEPGFYLGTVTITLAAN